MIRYRYTTDERLEKMLREQRLGRVIRWFADQYFTHDWPTLHKGRVIVAEEDGRLVGFFRYCRSGSDLDAVGTWVLRARRRRGIARTMWALALRQTKNVFVTTTSRAGDGLVRYVTRTHKKVRVSHLRS